MPNRNPSRSYRAEFEEGCISSSDWIAEFSEGGYIAEVYKGVGVVIIAEWALER